MVFAAYEFIQKRAERRWQEEWRKGWKEGRQKERERIQREVDALFSKRGVDRLPIEDIKRIIRPDRE
jgi:flagellar biosynthesis/type III secretory pathway protein FliH